MKRKRIALLLFPVLCLSVILLTWSALHGDGTTGDTDKPAEAIVNGGMPTSGLALRVVLALGLITILIFGAVYTLRVVGGQGGGQTSGKVKVVDRCYLAPKRVLYTVRMGKRMVVVGVTESNITPVLEFSEEESEELFPDKIQHIEETPGFHTLLKNVSAKIGRSNAQA